MDRNVFPKAAFACFFALAMPGIATAAPSAPSIDGPAAIAEAGEKATFTVNCGAAAGLAPNTDAPYVGNLSVAVSPGPAPAATEDADYGDPSTTSIVCPPVSGATVDVPIVNDTADEPGENFTVTITGTLTALGAADPNQVNVDVNASDSTTITDDDVPEVGIVQFVPLLEDAGPAQLTVTLSQTPVEPATVSFATENSSASAPGDFTATSGELTIPAGQTTGTITVPLVDDTAPEPVEGFYVNLSAPVNATLNATKTQAAVAIFDKDAPPLPAFSLPRGVTVEEGNSGTVNVLFPIMASPAPTETVRVNWRTANFSANTADYESANGTVTFEPGQTTKTVSVNVKGDRRDEPNEAFTLVLGNPVGGTVASGGSFGVITDDDGPKVGIGKPVARGKSLIMVLTCPETADLCKGRLAATIGKLKAGSVRFNLAKGAGTELKLRLSRKARAALAKRARRMKFTATAADASGAQRVTTKRFRVRRLR